MRQENARILSHEGIAQETYRLVLHCPQIAHAAQPGQFVHVLCGTKPLRRPISICRAEGDALTLVYGVRGEGTAWLSERVPGEELNLLGALGQGFPAPASDAPILLVGGGIGTPPLLDCAHRFAAPFDAILGFRSATQVILEDEYRAVCGAVAVCTEDGSHGTKGFVTAPMQEWLAQKKYAAVYACGPTPMLQAVAGLAKELGVPCFVSLEERMACGVGACLTCVVKIRVSGAEDYLRVCKNGPVFHAEEVVWA
ncbi:MAG: dihydroorotate dehydrogenase electron transfer subunit [Oscillospiraceae bacterium]|jgi:dihydroorotate dehydrogenase electron transfer subunit|nr:dihydroorotate dehydrogenase electron transfer subunit [Oscillospiraceae bacterium]